MHVSLDCKQQVEETLYTESCMGSCIEIVCPDMHAKHKQWLDMR